MELSGIFGRERAGSRALGGELGVAQAERVVPRRIRAPANSPIAVRRSIRGVSGVSGGSGRG